MEKINSSLFMKFEDKKVKSNQTSTITGGINVGFGSAQMKNDTRVTGDTDCTGDYMSPDCGDGGRVVPTTSNDDSCY